MREILFRGKRKDNGEWVYGDLSQHKNGKKFIKCGSATQSYDVIPETIGQYIGLEANGKKIFEGDILQTGTRMGYVIWNEGCFRFRWKNFDKHRGDFFKTCILTEYGSFEELKVIGNIHDNLELLKGGEQ